jgi:protein involved in polysaccharide export with SLBB domain
MGMRLLAVVCCVAVLLLGACAPKSEVSTEAVFAANDAVAAAGSVENPGYVIQAGDFLQVTSATWPNANCVGRVSEDGTVALKLVGYARAAGNTVEQFGQTLHELYKEVPGYEGSADDVTVHVKLGLYLVTGEITNGGFRTYAKGLTIYDAVVSGGKLTGKALTDRVFLNRKGADGREIIRYSRLEQLKALPLLENDWVVIPYRVDHLLN